MQLAHPWLLSSLRVSVRAARAHVVADEAQGHRRVLVASDQTLVADAVQTALAARGFVPVGLDGPLDAAAVPGCGGRLADVGLLIAALSSLRSVGVAEHLIVRSALPWVVVAGTPPGPEWGAMLAAGASRVLESTVSLSEIVAVLDDLVHGRLVPDPALDGHLLDQWQQARHERAELVARLESLTRWELMVLRLLCVGQSASRIADEHSVPVAAVEDVQVVLDKIDPGSQPALGILVGELLEGDLPLERS